MAINVKKISLDFIKYVQEKIGYMKIDSIKGNDTHDSTYFRRFNPDEDRGIFYYSPSDELMKKRRDQYLLDEFKGVNRDNLKEVIELKLNKYSEQMGGAKIRLSFNDLHNRYDSFNIDGNDVGWSASTIKVPVMVATFKEIDQKRLRLKDKLVVTHDYSLEKDDPVTKMDFGTKLSIKELLHYMIVVSDNESTNMLADTIGLKELNQYMHELGATRTMLAHLLTSGVPRLYTPWNLDGSNLITANDLTHLLTSIYTDEAASKRSCKLMRRILEKEKGSPLLRYLPKGTIIGSKTGVISDRDEGDDVHDVGVVNRDYALSILCNRVGYKDIAERKRERKELVEYSDDSDFDLDFEFDSDFVFEFDDLNSFPKVNVPKVVLKPKSKIKQNTKSNTQKNLVKSQWSELEGIIDEFNKKQNTPFYFDIIAEPIPYFEVKNPTTAIAVISKVVHDVYYHGEIRGENNE